MPWVRINDFDFEKNGIAIKYGTNGAFSFGHNGRRYTSEEITHVWYRRFAVSKPVNLNSNGEAERMIEERINKFAHEEKNALKHMLSISLSGKKWMNHPATSDINKLLQLETAKEVGLEIPETMVTNHAPTLKAFIRENGATIVKPVSNMQSIALDGISYVPFTTLVNDELLEQLGETFFPMLFQKMIPKKYEVRTFFLDGRCYSMAMFTQLSDKTKVDFRNYDQGKPSRRVPYQLPGEIESKLRKLMEKLQLNSGSFDLICTEDDRYCFLEVNPVGQFGMVSYPCNYYLEKIVAEYLCHE